MADVSHRDFGGTVLPSDTTADQIEALDARIDAIEADGSDAAAIAALDVRLDAAEVDINALETAVVNLQGVDVTLDTRLDTAEADIVALDARLDTAETDIAALEAADTSLDGRLDAIEANSWVTSARIADDNVISAKLINLCVTSGKIAQDAVTNAKLANMATATFKGRTTSGTGDPEDLTTTQATAMLNLATTSVKGLAPVLSNDTTHFLRGDGSYAAPKQRLFLFYGGAVMTAGDVDRFPNPVGFATSPIGTTGNGYHCPVAGNLIATHYRVTAAHTTNTVTVIPRVNGVQQTTQTQTINATVLFQSTTHATPLALAAGDFIACQMDHNGATNLAGLTVIFEIEF